MPTDFWQKMQKEFSGRKIAFQQIMLKQLNIHRQPHPMYFNLNFIS